MKASIMKLFLSIVALIAMLSTANADELTKAYEKEFAFLKARITSYNVCYTKLLRIMEA